MAFPAERFLRAGASFTETGEIGARYGAGTRAFDGAAEGEIRRVIAEHRARATAAAPDDSVRAAESDDDAAEAEGEVGDSPRPDSGDDGEGKPARNQSRGRRMQE